MKNISHYLAHLSVTAWVGSLWAIGYLAAPVLFYAQPDRQLAGLLAGELFVRVGYLGMICGTYLLIYHFAQSGRTVLRKRTFWVIAGMLAISLLIQFGIQPVMSEIKASVASPDVMGSASSAKFKMLHGLSSIAYLIESLLGIYLVVVSQGSRQSK
ncbi:MAG: DUF4149 domain-containing protein [Sideroxydans sp.]|jgi:hypothetical protein